MRRGRDEQLVVGCYPHKRNFKKLKSCFLKTGEKILELLEEVHDLLGGNSVPFLTSLRALVPAFSGLLGILLLG